MFCSMYMSVTLHSLEYAWSAASHWLHTSCRLAMQHVRDSAPASESNSGAQLDRHLLPARLASRQEGITSYGRDRAHDLTVGLAVIRRYH